MSTHLQSKFIRELGFHIRASYPFLLVVTDEHERLKRELDSLISGYLNKEAKGNKFKLYRWTCTDSWRLNDKKLPVATKDGEDGIPHTPIDDFKQILEFDPYGICVMENFHFYLTREQPELIQLVKDCSRECQKANKVVIFANSVMDFPQELESHITVLEHELPGSEDITQVMDAITESVKEKKLDIKLTEAKRYSTLEALKGMRINDIENALAYSVVTTKDFDAKVLLAEKCKAIKKAGMLEYVTTSVNMDSVGGLELAKKWMTLRKISFTDKAKKFNLHPPKGIVLVGVPGCGKSLIAQAAANLFEKPLIRFDLSGIFSKFVGESEGNIKKALKIVDAVAPCVLHIDEIEKGMSGASSSNSTDGGTSPRVFGTLLQWLNDHTSPVFVIATSNNIDSIPVEFTRKGRFDEIFFVNLPTSVERENIFRIQLASQKLDPTKYDIAELVKASANYTGAEIAHVIAVAKLTAANKDQPPSTQDIINEIKSVIPEAKKNKEKIDKIKSRAAQIAVPASLDEVETPAEVTAGGTTFRNVDV